MLLGRDPELEQVERLLTDLRAGGGRSMLVSGEAGIGKTALLRAARERASDVRVVEATGLEAEANLPFAALGEIVGPLIEHLPELPEPQREAMRAALALAGDTQPAANRLAACAGLLGVLRAAAATRPLLLLIDDAQWLDPASRECLGYAARRLDGAPVSVLAAVRTDGRELPVDRRLDVNLTLAGLDRDDARALLARAAGDLASATAESLVDVAAGNPLAIIELPTMLSEDQRRGLAPFDPSPAHGGALWDAFERRLAALDPEVGEAVLVAAAATDRALRPVADACRELEIPCSALEQAEEAGVLVLEEHQVLFSHPLVRGVAYRRASGSERRRVHAALARHAEPDARAWHLAAATIGSSPEVVSELEAAARRASARGAHATAADALERAASFAEDATQRTVLLLGGGLEAAVAGSYERSASMLEAIRSAEEPTMLAAIRHLLAMVTLTGGIRGALENHRALTEEAERIAPEAPDMAAAMHADAGVIATVAGDCRLALTSAERGAALLTDGTPAATRCQVHAMLGMGLGMAGLTAQAASALDEAGLLLDAVDPLSPGAQSIAFALHARLMTGQECTLRAELAALGEAARKAGGQGLVPYYLLVGADAAYRTGDWSAAEREIAEAIAIADHSAQRGPLSIAFVVRARINAARGRTQAARDDADAGLAAAEPPGYGSTLLWARATLGFLELGEGRPEAAIEQLELLEQMVLLAGLEDPLVVPWRPDLVEAFVRAGRDDDARRHAERLGEEAERSSVPLARALAARCEGLTEPDDFDDAFERALAAHAEADAPFEEARTKLAWGTKLHRARRRVDARRLAHEALEAFEALGAAPWAERARGELHAAGGIERGPLTDPYELTGQEQRVALAVARGATNREVAAELFLSPKTVEFHLGRVYRKLGVRSRTELAALVAEGGVPVKA